jgi:hypothetical protein
MSPEISLLLLVPAVALGRAGGELRLGGAFGTEGAGFEETGSLFLSAGAPGAATWGRILLSTRDTPRATAEESAIDRLYKLTLSGGLGRALTARLFGSYRYDEVLAWEEESWSAGGEIGLDAGVAGVFRADLAAQRMSFAGTDAPPKGAFLFGGAEWRRAALSSDLLLYVRQEMLLDLLASAEGRTNFVSGDPLGRRAGAKAEVWLGPRFGIETRADADLEEVEGRKSRSGSAHFGAVFRRGRSGKLSFSGGVGGREGDSPLFAVRAAGQGTGGRFLLATDAGKEGLSLRGSCSFFRFRTYAASGQAFWSRDLLGDASRYAALRGVRRGGVSVQGLYVLLDNLLTLSGNVRYDSFSNDTTGRNASSVGGRLVTRLDSPSVLSTSLEIEGTSYSGSTGGYLVHVMPEVRWPLDKGIDVYAHYDLTVDAVTSASSPAGGGDGEGDGEPEADGVTGASVPAGGAAEPSVAHGVRAGVGIKF